MVYHLSDKSVFGSLRSHDYRGRKRFVGNDSQQGYY